LWVLRLKLPSVPSKNSTLFEYQTNATSAQETLGLFFLQKFWGSLYFHPRLQMNPLHFVVSKQQKDKLLFIENIFITKNGF
jgi:hypothetical protein